MIISSEYQENKPDVTFSFCIPVYGQSFFTKNLVQDLLKLPSTYEIVICDNNSSDNTAEVVFNLLQQRKEDQARLVYIQAPVNLWHSGGSNKAFEVSSGRYVCFLNNDVRVKNDYASWPEKLIPDLEDGKIVGLTGGLLQNNFEFIRESSILEDSPYSYLGGWFLAAQREIWNKLRPPFYFDFLKKEKKEGLCYGPLDETLFYFNDYDLSRRARASQIPLVVGQAPLIHFGRRTVSQGNNISQLYLEGLSKIREKYN